MPGPTKLEFNEAVRECLANCYLTDIPISALAEYVELLKQRDWTPSEIHKVEAAVTKILLAVVSKSERDDLVTKLIQPREDSHAPPSKKPAADSSNSAGIPWPAPQDNELGTARS